METELTRTDQADGRRAQAWKALNLLTSPIDTAVAELGAGAPDAIDAAVALTEHEMRPVPVDPAERAAWTDALDERLRKLGAKVLPTAGDAANVWRDALVEALSDLPAMISLSAARKAIHQPFRFIGEVEPAIREIAAKMIEKRHARLLRLAHMRREIEAALRPTSALPSAPDFQPIGIEQMPDHIVTLGLKLKHLMRGEDGIVREAI